MALAKLLENTLDESSKIKNMSDERLGCLTKSLVSQNFYWTLSDISKTLISHSGNYQSPAVICSPGMWVNFLKTFFSAGKSIKTVQDARHLALKMQVY